MTVVLHDYWRSSAAYRVRIALNLKGIDYRSVPVDLVAGAQREAGYRARAPQGFVPMLEIDGLALTQSLAIVDYLDATRPEPGLIPAAPAARAQAMAAALVIAADVHPLNNLRVLRYLAGALEVDEPARDAWYRHWVVEGLGALETMATTDSLADGPYLGGGAPGVADVCLVPQLYNARRYAVDLAPFPRLVAIDRALTALPAFAAAAPEAVRP